jgi:hypothetical protein
MSKKLSNFANLAVSNPEKVKGGLFVRYSFGFKITNYVCMGCSTDNGDK